MAMVNMNNLLNMKDSRWLQLEVCREFQRNKCSRPDTECKFAHPPVNVEVQNGRVTACYDSIKGRCNREKPPCKYFHPPLHLKDQLLINGRNHLALKNALMQQMGMGPGQGVVPGQVPSVATNPYLGVTNSYNPYFPTGPLVSLVSDPSGAQVMSPLGVPQQAVIQQKNKYNSRRPTPRTLPRSLMSHFHGFQENQSTPFPMRPEYFRVLNLDYGCWPPPPPPPLPHDPFVVTLQPGINWPVTVTPSKASPDSTSMSSSSPNYPGMVTYKRPADKGGVPVYPQGNSASAAAYQHLMQLQQPFVPVSSAASIQHHLQQQQQQQTTSTQQSPVHATTSTSPESNGPSEVTEQDAPPLVKKMKSEGGEECGDEGGNGILIGEAEEESKDESAIVGMNVKRMRGNAGGTPPMAQPMVGGLTGSSAATAAVMVQNSNAAYAAAAQNYHSALAAMTYTGASLQANKGPQQGAGIPNPQASIQSQIQQYQGLQQHQQQQAQQAQNQQQQLIQQYQAMAAAAFASQAGFQGQSQSAAAVANQLTGQQLGGGLPFAMNPYLAALPQIAAAQRAQLLQQHSTAGAFQGLGQGLQGAGGGGGFNPFGLQGLSATGLTAANIQQFQQSQQQQQQQAILAAYGQFARAPVPVVSAAPVLTQQLYIGSPVAPAANGSLQGAVGVKRLRPG